MAGSNHLLAVSEAHYGDRYKSDFMTQYRDFVESAQQVSAKRHQANQFFSSINTVLLTASGLIANETSGLNWQIAIAGGLLCMVWRQMILAYANLNSAKFKVINEMEQYLPASTYKAEWEYFKAAKSSNLTSIEALVPRLFIGAYIFIFLFKLASYWFGSDVPVEVGG